MDAWLLSRRSEDLQVSIYFQGVKLSHKDMPKENVALQACVTLETFYRIGEWVRERRTGWVGEHVQ